jgi:hypothetical protein
MRLRGSSRYAGSDVSLLLQPLEEESPVPTYMLASLLLFVLSFASVYAQKPDSVIHPGAIWLDNRGIPIQAHGGGILQFHKVYYWFGEDRTQTNDPDKRYVGCYSSTDLVHWTFVQQLAFTDPEHIGPHWILERPKVFYNAPTKKFVLYIHLDGPGIDNTDVQATGYKLARVGVYSSDHIAGPYSYVHSFRPLDQESRDIGQFIDDDGTAYLIFESRPTKGFFIAKLSADYLTVARQTAFIHAPLEGGTLVHDKGRYYVIGSHMTGWAANPDVYATASAISGPWTEMQNIAPPETNTYGSQSSFLLKVSGSTSTSVIYMGDVWKPEELWDSRYLWMPLTIDEGALHLPTPAPWTINMKSGVVDVLPAASPLP